MNVPNDPKVFSFFSGALGLDLGFEQEGFKIVSACEADKHCIETIKRNSNIENILSDIWNVHQETLYDQNLLRKGERPLAFIGGPPCQSFSTAGSRKGFDDRRGNALLKYVDLITSYRPRFAVIENVRGLLSSPLRHVPHRDRANDFVDGIDTLPGSALRLVLNLLESAGYKISFNLYNAANFGVPQSRERVVLLCTLDEKPLPFLFPTHSERDDYGLPKWKTVRDAIGDLVSETHTYEQFPEPRLKYFKLLREGQNWRNLPSELQLEAMGKSYFSGGGKTGFFRRLAWNKPSCTLVTSPTMPATDMCHPEEDRPLSVQEYLRLQQFPDGWQVAGSVREQYRQIGNAVPVGLGRAIALCIRRRLHEDDKCPPDDFPFSRYKDTDHVRWRLSVEKAMGRQVKL